MKTQNYDSKAVLSISVFPYKQDKSIIVAQSTEMYYKRKHFSLLES